MNNIQTKFQKFKTKDYLNEYYSEIGEENEKLLIFFDKAYALIFKNISNASILELGGGPTIYQLISAARYNVEITFTDYLVKNFKEVSKWMNGLPESFDWSDYINYVVRLEGDGSKKALMERKQSLKRSIRYLKKCDLRKKSPIGHEAKFDIVSTNFVAESITNNIDDWEKYMKRIVGLVKNKGYLVLTAIVGSEFYRVGSKMFPSSPVRRVNIREILDKNHMALIIEDFVDAEHHEEQGYEGIYMSLSRKVDN